MILRYVGCSAVATGTLCTVVQRDFQRLEVADSQPRGSCTDSAGNVLVTFVRDMTAKYPRFIGAGCSLHVLNPIPGGRKKAFDDEAVEKMAAAPESQVLVPQRATGKANLAAMGMGAAITKEWLARECEARGTELPRAKKGKHAGEVPSTVTMDVIKR